MTAIPPARTLRELALADGLAFDDVPSMGWMLLTWDLGCSKFGQMTFERLLVTTEEVMVMRAPIARALYSVTAPRRAEVTRYDPTSGEELTAAIALTDWSLQRGFHPICRPLAVDCSALAPLLTDPMGLLEEVNDNGPHCARVLSTVNAARAAARATHLDPEALTRFPVRRVEQLWGAG